MMSLKNMSYSFVLFWIFSMQVQAQSQSTSDDWNFIVAPYGFLASIEGEAGLGRVGSTDISVDFGDILENLQLAGMLHGEIRKGSWGIILDLAFMNLGTSSTLSTGRVARADVDQLMLESFFAYRKGSSGSWIEILGGIRTLNIDLQLGLSGPAGLGPIIRGRTWVDPVVGTRGLVRLSERVFLVGRGDIGGFGVIDSCINNVLP